MRGKSRFVLGLLGCLCLLVASCGGDKNSGNGRGGNDASGDADTGRGSGKDAAADGGDGAVAVAVAVEGYAYRQGEVAHAGVIVELTGTGKVTETDDDGYFRFEDVKPGTYTITYTLADYAAATSNPFEVRAGETTKVKSITLKEGTGGLTGVALLEGETNHAGIAIVVQGASYSTVTAKNGAWAINGVEAGQYTIEASYTGYRSKTATDITVKIGQVTSVPTMTLTGGSLLADGTTCSKGSQCQSGYCVDDVCCENACDGTCEICNGDVDGSGHVEKDEQAGKGKCLPFEKGVDYDDECADLSPCVASCDGKGACRLDDGTGAAGVCALRDAGDCPENRVIECSNDQNCGNGEKCDPCGQCVVIDLTCKNNDGCALGHCVHGICCESDCSSGCMACDSASTGQADGLCRPLTKGLDPYGDCPDLGSCEASCDGAGACRVDDGAGQAESCIAQQEDCSGTGEGAQCETGFCVDGVCCNSACDGTCEACDIAGSIGVCTAYGFGDDPESECAGILSGIGCDAACDGRGGDGNGACLVSGCDSTLPYHPNASVWPRYTPYAENGDGTATDNLTGLMWIQCAYGQTWSAGPSCSDSAGAMFWQDAMNYCDGLSYAGQDDWRLPSVKELATLVDASRFTPAVQASAFPGSFSTYFWSSSSYANDGNLAWGVTFDGSAYKGDKATAAYNVRCVRGGTLVVESFSASVVSGNRIVEDSATDLIWQGCAAGLSGDSCQQDSAITYYWQDAISYCETSTWAGFDDWRLPDRNELMTIADYGQYHPAIDGASFPLTPTDGSWSSSPNGTSLKWFVNFDDGFMFGADTSSHLFYARCVRGGL